MAVIVKKDFSDGGYIIKQNDGSYIIKGEQAVDYFITHIKRKGGKQNDHKN